MLLSVSWAYKECPKFENPELDPPKCISQAYGRPFRTSDPTTICVEMSLRCYLLQKLQSNCTILTFKCFTEDDPQTQLTFERRVPNATWIEQLTSAEKAIIRICVVPDIELRGLKCVLFADIDEEVIRRGYFHFNVDLKRMQIRRVIFLQNQDTYYSCNCSHYERFFNNQWRLCFMSGNQSESNPPGQPIMLIVIVVGFGVSFILSFMSSLLKKCIAKK